MKELVCIILMAYGLLLACGVKPSQSTADSQVTVIGDPAGSHSTIWSIDNVWHESKHYDVKGRMYAHSYCDQQNRIHTIYFDVETGKVSGHSLR
jgi:hypothetical protein